MNSFTLSTKTIPDLKKFHDAIKLAVPEFTGLLLDGSSVTVLLNTEPTSPIIAAVEAVSPPSIPALEIYTNVVSNARNFGTKIIVEFAAENIIMGITQDNMTTHVRTACNEVVNCLITGSLYDAIKELKAIPVESRDAKYLTPARMTAFCNKIEDYLGVTRTTVV